MIKISVNEKVCREWADFLQKEEGILKQYKRKLTVLGIIISLAVLVCGCGENSPKPEESEPSSVASQTQVFTCLGTWEITGAQQDDGMHRSDTMQEKLSLVARFGVTISFSKPTQKEYFRIVTELAKRYPEITLSDQELCAEANKWEMSHGGISGRTAQQFINYLAGRIGEEKAKIQA